MTWQHQINSLVERKPAPSAAVQRLNNYSQERAEMAEANILAILEESPKRISELSAELGKHDSTLRIQLVRMQHKGLVKLRQVGGKALWEIVCQSN